MALVFFFLNLILTFHLRLVFRHFGLKLNKKTTLFIIFSIAQNTRFRIEIWTENHLWTDLFVRFNRLISWKMINVFTLAEWNVDASRSLCHKNHRSCFHKHTVQCLFFLYFLHEMCDRPENANEKKRNKPTTTKTKIINWNNWTFLILYTKCLFSTTFSL